MALLCPVLSFAQQIETSVYFESAQSGISLKEHKNLEKFIKNLPRDIKYFDFLLTGHTDNMGNEEYNNQLSRNRCRSVKDFFINHRGVPKKLYKKDELVFFEFIFPGKSQENGIKKHPLLKKMTTLFKAEPSMCNIKHCFDNEAFNHLYLDYKKSNWMSQIQGTELIMLNRSLKKVIPHLV